MRKIKISTLLQRIADEEKRVTIPTILTIGRILLTPFIVGAMLTQHWGVAFFLFLIAACTDLIDGFLARTLNEQTFLGACLDPVADKLLIIACFVTLAFSQSPLFSVPKWFVLFVLLKELIQVGGAIIIWYRKGHIEVKPTILGKATMLMQTIFIIWLFACYFFHWMPIKTYYTVLSVLLVLVFSCLVQYGIKGYQYITNSSA